MWHIWLGLGLITGAGSASVSVNPLADDSVRRIGVRIAASIPTAIGERIANAINATAIGERANGAIERRVGARTAPATGRRIG